MFVLYWKELCYRKSRFLSNIINWGFCPLLTLRVCTDYQNVITSDICFTSLQICGSLEEEEDFLGMISTFLISSQQYLGLFKFLGRNHLIIKENWHISVILGLFRVTEILTACKPPPLRYLSCLVQCCFTPFLVIKMKEIINLLIKML